MRACHLLLNALVLYGRNSEAETQPGLIGDVLSMTTLQPRTLQELFVGLGEGAQDDIYSS